MNIDIYSKYKVRFLDSGTYKLREPLNLDIHPDNIAYTHYECDEEKIIDGGRLLKIIKSRLDDSYLQKFSVIGNTMRIEIFNHMNGESNKYIMVIERYLESKGE